MDKALRYVLEVYRQVRQFGASRIDAAKMVAKKHRISQQAVMSACTRDVGIKNTAMFDELIEPEYTSEFRSHLVQRYPAYQKDINRFFKPFGEAGDQDSSSASKLETLFDDERKNLLNQLMIDVFKDKFIEWGKRSDIPSDVRNQIHKWLRVTHK